MLIDILDDGSSSILSIRVESWAGQAVGNADCKVKEHTIALAVSRTLFKEYQARINAKFGDKRLSRGFNEYLEMNHGKRIRKTTSKGDFFFVPYSFRPDSVPWNVTDDQDTKLLEIAVHLLSEKRFSDRNVIVGCRDRPTSNDIWDICARKVRTARDRLKMAHNKAELTDMIADH